MKEGLSGSVINEVEVNDRWEQAKQDARRNLNRLKELEKNNPKRYIKNGIGYHTEGFRELASSIMKKRSKEIFKRTQE